MSFVAKSSQPLDEEIAVDIARNPRHAASGRRVRRRL
jgi:hypothetical protein